MDGALLVRFCYVGGLLFFFLGGTVYAEMKPRRVRVRVCGCVDVLVHEVNDLSCSYGVLLVASGL